MLSVLNTFSKNNPLTCRTSPTPNLIIWMEFTVIVLYNFTSWYFNTNRKDFSEGHSFYELRQWRANTMKVRRTSWLCSLVRYRSETELNLTIRSSFLPLANGGHVGALKEQKLWNEGRYMCSIPEELQLSTDRWRVRPRSMVWDLEGGRCQQGRVRGHLCAYVFHFLFLWQYQTVLWQASPQSCSPGG